MYSNTKSAYTHLDKQKILANVKPLTYVEARRKVVPLAQALLIELYESGCTKCASGFEAIIRKEKELLKKINTYSPLIRNEELLVKIFNNIKAAEELSVKELCGSYSECFHLLYCTIKLLEPYERSHEVIVGESFLFIAEHCDKYIANAKSNKDQLCTIVDNVHVYFEGIESIARIYFSLAKFLQDTGRGDLTAIQYFEKTEMLTRSQDWGTEGSIGLSERYTLHQATGERLTIMLIKYSKVVQKTNSEEAIDYARKAILTIAERGIKNNLYLFLDARLTLVEILLGNRDFETAFTHITNMKPYFPKTINDEDTDQVKILFCKISLYDAICDGELDKLESYEEKFEECLLLMKKFNFSHLHGKALLEFGKILWQHQQFEKAGVIFEATKTVFLQLGDFEMHKRTIYVFAKLKSEEIFKPFLNLLQGKGYAVLPVIRKWKYRKAIFWIEDNSRDITLQSYDDAMYAE
ncbi:uncharacterized protein LOC119671442 [Teleopsis dalmanni]|uniref:uncharacterized protein LOC119671442 n=1 Tax=Teleopsis dalmanni TaxID=139649 RepID=UPI0018CDFB83|nr:uncharacterized protein LOC119671442 [Teleopsis dalmanni]